MPDTNIVLQTKLGNKIENFQSDSISLSEYRFFENQLLNYPLAIKRSEIEPHYNCFGLVFASRRTCVTSDNEISKILKEDGYKNIEKTLVEPGDIVLYLTSKGDYVHSGIVIEKPTKDNYFMPYIFSKWGRANEFIHKAIDSPYDSSNLKYYRIITNA